MLVRIRRYFPILFADGNAIRSRPDCDVRRLTCYFRSIMMQMMQFEARVAFLVASAPSTRSGLFGKPKAIRRYVPINL